MIKLIHGKTKAPSRPLYVKYQKAWPTLEKLVNPPVFDKITKLNWHKKEFQQVGSDLRNLLLDTKMFCETALSHGIFIRGDYEYLTKLVVIFLGGTVPYFSVRQARNTCDAHWMINLIYNLEMLMNYEHLQFLHYDDAMIEKLTLTSEYVCLFHAKSFLQAPIAY